MNSNRSGFRSLLEALRAIDAGRSPNEIKSKLELSRYSFQYTINRLLKNNLITENQDETYTLTQKGRNVLGYYTREPRVFPKTIVPPNGTKALGASDGEVRSTL